LPIEIVSRQATQDGWGAMIALLKRTRIGVGARIYLAIGAIVSLTIIASVVASVSFDRVTQTVRSLFDDHYPVVELSRELVQVAGATVAMAPKLADITADKDRVAIVDRLAQGTARMRVIVEDLHKRKAVDRARIMATIDQLAANIQQMDKAARQRVAIEAQKAEIAESMSRARVVFNQVLSSAVDETQFALQIGLQSAGEIADADKLKATLKKLADEELARYGTSLQLLAELNQAYGLLREAIAVDRAEQLEYTLGRFKDITTSVDKALQDSDAKNPDPNRRRVTEAVLAFGTGTDNVFILREREFANRKSFAQNLTAVSEVATGLNTEIDRIVAGARNAANSVTQSSLAMMASSSLWLILIGAASVLAAAGIAFFIVRPKIVVRLRHLSRVTLAIAEGQLDTKIGDYGTDEIGDVAKAVRIFRDAAIEKIRLEGQAQEQQKIAGEERMRNEQARNAAAQQVEMLVAMLGRALSGMAHGDLLVRLTDPCAPEYAKVKEDFNAALTTLQETICAIRLSAQEVSNASAEISASTTDLSQRTEEQAANLEETTSSLERIAAIVRKNAERAQQASQFAGKTRAVADRGGEVVTQAMGAMSRIEESSREISDIINLIDEIARQTNLLALNAAVEAARAGEAGRGFAVVASEVRSLAQRSSEAAKGIRGLITSSSGRVQEGVEFVNRAGSALGDIVESIKQVVDIVSEIAAASGEQASGIEEVNRALARMDEVTQQNSALVEENAATAKALSQQASEMTDRVDFFQLEDAAAQRAA
jgi:methyl-accepting chemotaxis protein